MSIFNGNLAMVSLIDENSHDCEHVKLKVLIIWPTCEEWLVLENLGNGSIWYSSSITTKNSSLYSSLNIINRCMFGLGLWLVINATYQALWPSWSVFTAVGASLDLRVWLDHRSLNEALAAMCTEHMGSENQRGEI